MLFPMSRLWGNRVRALLCAGLLLSLSPATALAREPLSACELHPEDATYTIDGDPVTLSGGTATRPVVAGAATQIVTTLGDTTLAEDVNADGRPDLVVLLTHSPGGSGTFTYLATLLCSLGGDATATNSVSLGDRVHVQRLEATDGVIAVTYLTRRPGEPLSTPPSQPVQARFHIQQRQLVRLQAGENDRN